MTGPRYKVDQPWDHGHTGASNVEVVLDAPSGDCDDEMINDKIDYAERRGGGSIVGLPGETYLYKRIENGQDCTLDQINFRFMPDVADVHLGVDANARYGIGYKSGITACHFRRLNIDGNEANNRTWDVNGVAFGTLRTNNLYLTSNFHENDAGVPPLLVTIDDVYSHDAVRNCFVISGDSTVVIGAIRGENSACDHVMYFSDSPGQLRATVGSIVAGGFCRGGLLVSQAALWGRIIVNGLAANPTITHPNNVSRILEVRSNRSGRPTLVHSMAVMDYDPDLGAGGNPPLAVVGWQGPVSIDSLYVEQATDSTTDARMVFADSTTSTSGSPSTCRIGSLHVKNAMAAGLALVRATQSFKAVTIDSALIEYRLLDDNNAATANDTDTALIQCVRGGQVSVRALTAVGRGQRLFTTTAGEPSRLSFRNVSMVDGCDTAAPFNAVATGGSATIADSEFLPSAGTIAITATALGLVKFDNAKFNGKPTGASGAATFSGDGATTTFNIPHGLAKAPQQYTVTPRSAAAGAARSVSADGTNLTITFAAAPAPASNSLVFGYSADISPTQVAA